jgi:hypothetical protein
MTERRQHSRNAARLALFDAGSGTFGSVEVRDLSPGGAFLLVSDHPTPGSELRLAITRQSDSARVRELVEVRGRVKWVAEDGVGVEFEEPTPQFLEQIAHLLSRPAS